MSKKLKEQEKEREQDDAAERAGARGVKVQLEVVSNGGDGHSENGHREGIEGDDYGLRDKDDTLDDLGGDSMRFEAQEELPEGNRKRVESAADSVEGGATIEMTELR
jgi:hypothetical protein